MWNLGGILFLLEVTRSIISGPSKNLPKNTSGKGKCFRSKIPSDGEGSDI